MKQYLVIIVSLLLRIFSQGQSSQTTNSDTGAIFVVEEIPPKFPGGDEKLFKIIKDSLKCPESALKDDIGGRLITQFTIDTLGNVKDIKIIKGVREDLDNEAIRLVGLLNGWTPATQNGKKVRVVFSLPLTFSCTTNKENKKKKHRR